MGRVPLVCLPLFIAVLVLGLLVDARRSDGRFGGRSGAGPWRVLAAAGIGLLAVGLYLPASALALHLGHAPGGAAAFEPELYLAGYAGAACSFGLGLLVVATLIAIARASERLRGLVDAVVDRIGPAVVAVAAAVVALSVALHRARMGEQLDRPTVLTHSHLLASWYTVPAHVSIALPIALFLLGAAVGLWWAGTSSSERGRWCAFLHGVTVALASSLVAWLGWHIAPVALRWAL